MQKEDDVRAWEEDGRLQGRKRGNGSPSHSSQKGATPWHGHLRHPASRTVRQETVVWALQSAVPCGGSPSKPEDCCSHRTGFSTTCGSISRCRLFPECQPTWGKQKRIKEHLLIHTSGREEIVMIATVYEVLAACVSNKIMFNTVMHILTILAALQTFLT